MRKAGSAEQRAGHALLPAPRASAVASLRPPPVYERAQQREVVREVFEQPLEVAFGLRHAGPRLAVAPVAPRGELRETTSWIPVAERA